MVINNIIIDNDESNITTSDNDESNITTSDIMIYNNITDKNQFIFNCVVCGMSFYLYNEIQNIVLDLIGAVPMAVGNTLKRVAIFAALFVFIPGETFPPAKTFGCAIAIVGCLAYAVFDAKKI